MRSEMKLTMWPNSIIPWMLDKGGGGGHVEAIIGLGNKHI